MTPDAAGIEAALAAGLAAHYTYTAGRGMTVRCKCGEVVGERGGRASIGNSATHRAHVAAALLPVVTQAQAEAWDGCHRSTCEDAFTGSCRDHPNPYRARADESGAR